MKNSINYLAYLRIKSGSGRKTKRIGNYFRRPQDAEAAILRNIKRFDYKVAIGFIYARDSFTGQTYMVGEVVV